MTSSMFEEAEELKQSLAQDDSFRRQLFSLPPGIKEIGMTFFDLGRGSDMCVLSPSHLTEAAYFCIVLRLAPGAAFETDGDFECIVPDGLIRMPVRELEAISKGAVGRSETPTQRFVSPLINEGSVQRRFGLRLASLSQLPADFLLFFPRLSCGGATPYVTPVLFRTLPGRGVCIVDVPKASP